MPWGHSLTFSFTPGTSGAPPREPTVCLFLSFFLFNTLRPGAALSSTLSLPALAGLRFGAQLSKCRWPAEKPSGNGNFRRKFTALHFPRVDPWSSYPIHFRWTLLRRRKYPKTRENKPHFFFFFGCHYC